MKHLKIFLILLAAAATAAGIFLIGRVGRPLTGLLFSVAAVCYLLSAYLCIRRK